MTEPATTNDEERTLPSYAEVQRALGYFMHERGEWAGLPMPVEGLTLDIAPGYPHREFLTEPQPLRDVPAVARTCSSSDVREDESYTNHWTAGARRREVFIVRSGPAARARAEVFPAADEDVRLAFLWNSFAASWVHGIEAEMAAMTRLFEYLSEGQRRYYFVLGMFIETSKRSGVTYIFRRSRPTLALRLAGSFPDGRPIFRCLAALCLHPIGYYRDSWVGAMTPSDDVIAHLLMMRGDEHLFWKRSNQHPPSAPNAGL